ncbi:MAG: hypothetical protein KAQ98_07210 [Bacteriovoracaceae bacterium]|nr:hypothetical protein [Bacteriovoracaceae bacterium]
MNEERKMILKMLEDGKINAGEADKLLWQLNNNEETDKLDAINKDPNKKFLRINITDDEGTKVKVNLPIALAEIGLKMAPKEKLEIIDKKGIHIEDIVKLIEEGAEGELVNIESQENGKNTSVKIFIA